MFALCTNLQKGDVTEKDKLVLPSITNNTGSAISYISSNMFYGTAASFMTPPNPTRTDGYSVTSIPFPGASTGEAYWYIKRNGDI
jgi:hypothetical protein